MSEIKKLAKELQDYTRVVGSHNKHIQSVANRLVELTDQPQLNENQQIVLERLKELTVSFDLADAIYRFENSENWGESEERYDLAYEALNDKERLQVIQVACHWALEQEEEK